MEFYGIFFMRSDVALLRQMNSSLRMGTERSLRIDVDTERFVGKNKR
jgi:hypothetical protein